MTRIIFSVLFLFVLSANAWAQGSDATIKAQEIRGVIQDQSPSLQEYKDKLEIENAELEERIIVLKYHKGNKEVDAACRSAVKRIEEYYANVTEKMSEFEHEWYEQLRNVITVYTKYGELNEASGGGANELEDFVRAHSDYLDLMDMVQTDLITVYTNMTFIKAQI